MLVSMSYIFVIYFVLIFLTKTLLNNPETEIICNHNSKGFQFVFTRYRPNLKLLFENLKLLFGTSVFWCADGIKMTS